MLELPKNKPLINGKYKDTDSIKQAILKVLNQNDISGKYKDDNWSAIKKIQTILNNNGIQFELLDVDYTGQGEAPNSNLPTKKIYRFKLDVRDKQGKNTPAYLKVNCTFIGTTGTMADKEYQVSLSFF